MAERASDLFARAERIRAAAQAEADRPGDDINAVLDRAFDAATRRRELELSAYSGGGDR